MLPFCVNRMLGAVTEYYGTLLPKPEGLQIVFQAGSQEEVNPLDVEVKSVTIPWSSIRAIEEDRGLMSTSILIALSGDPVLADVPFVEKGQLKLTIRKQDTSQVEAFLSLVRASQKGQAASDTDDFIDEMRNFLWDL